MGVGEKHGKTAKGRDRSMVVVGGGVEMEGGRTNPDNCSENTGF